MCPNKTVLAGLEMSSCISSPKACVEPRRTARQRQTGRRRTGRHIGRQKEREGGSQTDARISNQRGGSSACWSSSHSQAPSCTTPIYHPPPPKTPNDAVFQSRPCQQLSATWMWRCPSGRPARRIGKSWLRSQAARRCWPRSTCARRAAGRPETETPTPWPVPSSPG